MATVTITAIVTDTVTGASETSTASFEVVEAPAIHKRNLWEKLTGKDDE